jgi:hypothetical protein
MRKIGTFFAFVSAIALMLRHDGFSEEGLLSDLTWILQGGIKHGSVVGRTRVDGMTGATKTLWSASGGAEFKVKRHHLEGGLIFGQTDQHLDYRPEGMDIIKQVSGPMDISLSLLDVNVLYNFHFFPAAADRENGRLIVGIGPFASFVLSKEIDFSGVAGPDKLSSWAMGGFFRFSYFPVELNRVRPGLFFDFYRSFFPKYFYDYAYFKDNGISGQLGTINFGISFRIK